MLTCPNCASLDRLYRSHRRWYHVLQRLIGLRRYFCDACGRYFWSWQHGPQTYGRSRRRTVRQQATAGPAVRPPHSVDAGREYLAPSPGA